MDREALIKQIFRKRSYLCVGLDTDITRIPEHLLKEKDPVFEFNKQIIDATYPFAVAYKPNLAFYEAQGSKGWESLEKTMAYLPKDVFKIADAKRGDIGNTAEQYAKAFFEHLDFDALTLSPYMGMDTIRPFLTYEDKWVIVLALTSNLGSADIQETELISGNKIFQEVITSSKKLPDSKKIMYVVGATKTDHLSAIRKQIPDSFLLIPGVGAQGGSLEKVSQIAMTNQCDLIVNSSRSIIYASPDKDFAVKARKKAQNIHEEMKRYLSLYT